MAGKPESRKVGRLERRKEGKNGRMEEWKNGRSMTRLFRSAWWWRGSCDSSCASKPKQTRTGRGGSVEVYSRCAAGLGGSQPATSFRPATSLRLVAGFRPVAGCRPVSGLGLLLFSAGCRLLVVCSFLFLQFSQPVQVRDKDSGQSTGSRRGRAGSSQLPRSRVRCVPCRFCRVRHRRGSSCLSLRIP